MKNLLVILRVVSMVIFVVGMIALIYFHIEIISMIYKETYKVYCESPDQILFALQGRLIIIVPTTMAAISWLVIEKTKENLKWSKS